MTEFAGSVGGMALPLARERRSTSPAGRECAHEECDTVLSIYNKSDWCGVHRGARSADRSLLRIQDEM